jgi:hypothetical protein
MHYAVSCSHKYLLLKSKSQTQKEDVHSQKTPATAGKIYVYRRVFICL